MKPEITKTPVFWGEKIFLWTLGILIIGIALFFLTYVIQSYRQESTHLANEIIKVSNNIQRETEHYFEKYKITLETLSLTPFVTKQETEVCNQVFEKLNADFPNVVNYAAVDKNGAFFCSGIPMMRPGLVTKMEFFLQLAQGKSEYIMEPHKGPISGMQVTGVSISLLNSSSEFDGIIGVSVRFQELKDLWERVIKEQAQTIVIVGREQTILFASEDFAHAIGKSLRKLDPNHQLSERHSPEIVSMISHNYLYQMSSIEKSEWKIIVFSSPHLPLTIFIERHPEILIFGFPLIVLIVISLILFIKEIRFIPKRKQTEDELRKHREHLEELVEKRTIALHKEIIERKLIEADLRKSETLLSKMGEISKIGGWEVDLETMTSTWTDEAGKIHEVEEIPSVEEAMNFYIPESRSIMQDAFGKLIAEGESYDLELQLITAKGRHIWVSTMGSPIYNDTGNIIKATGIIQDITERKQAREALRESEEKYRSLITNIPGVSYRCRCDEQWTMEFISDEVRNLTGYPASDFLQNAVRSWASIMHPEDKEASDERAMRKINRKEPYTTEYRIIGADGDIRWCYEKGQGVFDEQGKLCYLDGVIIDNTDRKQAEEALRESEERFRTVADFTYNWEYWIAPDGKYLYVSPSCERITGYTPDEFINVPGLLKKIVHPDDHSNIADHFQGEEGLEKSHSVDFRIITRSGEERWINHVCQPVHSTDGQYLGRRGSNHDISKQKKMQEELLKAKKLESLGVLAGGIAHDFNNLMSVVMGNISLARTEMRPGSKGFKNLVKAEKASVQTTALTSRLITFSKGGGPVKEPVSIGDLVKNSVDSSLKGSDISCIFSVPEDILPVEVDEEQMKQVIHNITTNAQEAMTEQGTINVSCGNVIIGEKDTLNLKDGKYVKISIKDHGPGIPEEELMNIFDPYFSTKEMGTQKGMGLGLAVSDSIVKKHDGLITIKSELGTGTTLYIYLPASVKEIDEAAPVKKPVPEISVTQGGKILVMDDEEVIRDVCNALLTHLGYEAEVAVEGVEAIELYKKAMESEKPFDMVILDLTNKIGMGGAETMVNLLEIDPDVKAIVASGYSNDPLMSNFREHGFHAALPKPFNLDKLKEALHDAIAGE